MKQYAKIFRNEKNSWTIKFMEGDIALGMVDFGSKASAVNYAYSLGYTAKTIRVPMI